MVVVDEIIHQEAVRQQISRILGSGADSPGLVVDGVEAAEHAVVRQGHGLGIRAAVVVRGNLWPAVYARLGDETKWGFGPRR